MNLAQGLIRAAQIKPHQVAVVDEERSLTWLELLGRVRKLAGAFRDLGLRPGGRVALVAPNSHRALEVFLGVVWSGGIVAPISFRLKAHEIAAQIGEIDPDLIVVSPDFGDVESPARSTARIVTSDAASTSDLFGYEACLSRAAPIPEPADGGDRAACIFFTGGTTGKSKGVVLSHDNIMANSVNFISELGLDERLVHLHCGPLFHVAAAVRLFSTTQLAGKHVFLPGFSAEPVLEAIERHGVTLATFVPTMLRALLDAEGRVARDLSSLEYITYGAAPMPPSLLQETMAAFPWVRFAQSYGMTETSPIITMLGWRDHRPEEAEGRKRLQSAGRPALLAEVRVAGPDGRAAATGEAGEVLARGPMVMRGYWRNPEETARAVTDGWMHTGDVGYLDEAGYLFVVDRLKDVVITGGENVYCVEVEAAILDHPQVRECAIVGRPDLKWGETVHAVVVARTAGAVQAEDIVGHCRERLAAYKCPKTVEIRTGPLPLTGANKVDKRRLRAELQPS